jgi:hypothetical protein
MLALKRLPRLPQLQDALRGYSAEERLEIELLAKPLVLLQELPDVALVALSGVVLPTHQRTLLYQMHRGVGNNVVVASRGTSKTSCVCVLYAGYCGLVMPKRTLVTLSATGFRGGQFIFQDMERWLRGGWDSQEQVPPFFAASIPRDALVNKSQNYWMVEYDSFSRNVTVPTKDEDAIRGLRGHVLLIDEANLASDSLIDRVAKPFLNVKTDFKHGGAFASSNQVFYTSTLDYSYRPFMERVRAARQGIERDYAAYQALQAGNWELYRALDREELHANTYTMFDYTDLLIREQFVTRTGQRYRVRWPNPLIPPTHDERGIPFTALDERGEPIRHVGPTTYYSTYPVDKESLERALFDGSADTDSWLSEQRNIVDDSVGAVYSHALVDQASCVGEACITPFEAMPDYYRNACKGIQRDYVAPVLWECTDPCVLGVDYAPNSDFCAFVVIRLGPVAGGEYNYLTHLGRTTWSNVVWAEQHRKMPARDAAEKVRELAARYHLVYFHEPHVDDPWLACRGIGLDMKGGGSSVRDELVFLNQDVPPGQYRFYDPLDKDERFVLYATDARAKPILDCIQPSDQLNDRLVEFTISQMNSRQLYLPKYVDRIERARTDRKLDLGFEATRALDHQLRKLQQRPTTNYRKFYMAGDTKRDENKKDLWAAFIYAARQMRAHLIRQSQIDNTPPPLGARITTVGSKRGTHGRAPGARL